MTAKPDVIIKFESKYIVPIRYKIFKNSVVTAIHKINTLSG